MKRKMDICIIFFAFFFLVPVLLIAQSATDNSSNKQDPKDNAMLTYEDFIGRWELKPKTIFYIPSNIENFLPAWIEDENMELFQIELTAEKSATIIEKDSISAYGKVEFFSLSSPASCKLILYNDDLNSSEKLTISINRTNQSIEFVWGAPIDMIGFTYMIIQGEMVKN